MHLNGINEQDEVPLLPIFIDDVIEESKEEILLDSEEDDEPIYEDESIIGEINTHTNDVKRVIDEEQTTENNVELEDVQTVDEDVIVEDMNDTLRSNDEETPRSENISGRLKPKPLTTDHLNKYEREHQYISFKKHVNILKINTQLKIKMYKENNI